MLILKQGGEYKYTALQYAIEQIVRGKIDKSVAKILIKNGAKLSEEEQKNYNKKEFLELCDKNGDRTNNKLDEMVCVVKILFEKRKLLKEITRQLKKSMSK